MTPKNSRLASWQLPDGVSGGTWDYSLADSIATEYDDYFRDHGMFGLDQEVISKYVEPDAEPRKWVIDLGCGTGRAILPLIDRGLNGVAFDLSQPMLDAVRVKASGQGQSAGHFSQVRGNLVDLTCFADDSFDYAICLFSTLGMIRGSESRERMVEHVARILTDEGLFVFQVHNYWAHLFDPEGPWWMLRNFIRSKVKRDVEIGDKFFPYRGIPDMYLHSFTKRELHRLLRRHSFELVEWLPLNARQDGPLSRRRFAEAIRASGWIVVARKNSQMESEQ